MLKTAVVWCASCLAVLPEFSPAAAAPGPAPAQYSGDPFTVSRGQLTFDLEGIENPTSRFHSRRLQSPASKNSGVALGRGYDMKLRTRDEVEKNLTAAGVSSELANRFAGGAGLTGESAKNFAEENREYEISPEQQKKLFELTYAKEEAAVRRIVSKPDVVEKYGATDWEQLNPAIRDVIIDLKYRGGYTPETRQFLQTLVAKGDLEGLIKVMGDRSKWPGVSTARFLARLNHLRAAAGLPPARLSIGFDDDAPKKKGRPPR